MTVNNANYTLLQNCFHNDRNLDKQEACAFVTSHHYSLPAMAGMTSSCQTWNLASNMWEHRNSPVTKVNKDAHRYN